MLSFAFVGLSGCAEKDKASSEVSEKTVETKENTNSDNTKAPVETPKKQENSESTQTNSESKSAADNKSTKTTNKKTKTTQANQEKEVHDFVLENTKMVQVLNISRRVHEKHPDLGPFYVVRGIDVRGQKSEIWIKDMKIFEMVNTK